MEYHEHTRLRIEAVWILAVSADFRRYAELLGVFRHASSQAYVRCWTGTSPVLVRHTSGVGQA